MRIYYDDPAVRYVLMNREALTDFLREGVSEEVPVPKPVDTVSGMMARLHTREEIEVFTTARAVYQVLSSLHIGDPVPEQCYILDYRNGSIPLWEVQQREQDDELVVLVLINRDAPKQATLFEPTQWVARQVLALSNKILATPPYLLGLEGAGPRPVLCDLVQQARAVAKTPQSFPMSKKGKQQL